MIAFLVFLGAAAGLSRAVGPKQVEQPAGAKSASTSAGFSVVQDVRKNTPEPQQVRGIVVDLAGRPVAGAEVRVDAFTSRETPGVTGRTDHSRFRSGMCSLAVGPRLCARRAIIDSGFTGTTTNLPRPSLRSELC